MASTGISQKNNQRHRFVALILDSHKACSSCGASDAPSSCGACSSYRSCSLCGTCSSYDLHGTCGSYGIRTSNSL